MRLFTTPLTFKGGKINRVENIGEWCISYYIIESLIYNLNPKKKEKR